MSVSATEQHQLAQQLSGFLSEAHPSQDSPRMIMVIYHDGSSVALDPDLNMLKPSWSGAQEAPDYRLAADRRRGRTGGDAYDV